MSRTQTPPNMVGVPKISIFNAVDFDAAIWGNGYDVILEEAISCPCRGDSPAAQADCGNCMGMGWFFINPMTTRAFLSSINRNTKYKEWSPEMVGTVSVTFMNVNRFGFMWKVTMLKHYGMISETAPVATTVAPSAGYTKFAFATYKMTEIKNVFVYNTSSTKLIRLASTEYRVNPINPFVVDLKPTNLPVGFNNRVSISYNHLITYNIIDIPHDMRITKEYNEAGKRTTKEMPIQAVARKAQYELGTASNFSGSNIFDNSYL